MPYIELHAHSAYSFLDGASQPEELAARAAELGYRALALTDHDGIYGSLEFAYAAKHFGVRPITGAELTLDGGSHVTLLVESPQGYANLCRLITDAHARTRPKEGREPLPPSLDPRRLEQLNDGLVCLSGCARHGLAVRDPDGAARIARAFGPDRFFVELQRPYERGDVRRNAALRDLAETLNVRTVATGDAHAHDARRAALQDVLVAIRCRTSLDGSERERRGNHESVLAAPQDMLDRFPDDRDATARTAELAERLTFDLTEELGYRYPDFSDGVEPAIVQLRAVCEHAFVERYSNLNGHKRRVRERLEEELVLIDELGLAGFFLLHWEVLELAREIAYDVRGPGSMRHVLPPGRGRGSSVGSLVCYLTGLSHVDPVANNLSLGRFLNRELSSVPDIDLDFPRDIREKLIVGVTEKYGREHASLVASFATYRSRGAIRDVGKALGLPFADLERLAKLTDGWNASRVGEEVLMLPDAARKMESRRGRAVAGPEKQRAAAADRGSALEGELKSRGADAAAAARRADDLAAKVKDAEAKARDYRDKLAAEQAVAMGLRKEIDKRLSSLEDADKSLEGLRAAKGGLERELDRYKRDLDTARQSVAALEDDKKNLAAAAERERLAADNRFAGIQLTGRRVIFLVDMSGSMEYVDEKTVAPEKWSGVRETLTKIMRSLPKLEKYQVILFSDKVKFLFDDDGDWLDYDGRSAARAAGALAAVKPKGGTNMYAAFETAFRYRAQGLDTIYFLSDGLPNMGEGLSEEQARGLKETEQSDILGKYIRRKLRLDWNRDIRGQGRVKVNAVGFFYESPDVGAFLWALTRENDGGFVGMSKP